MRHALLLKDPPDDPSTDPYAVAFTAAGYRPHFISPLSTVFPSSDDGEALRETLAGGARGSWSGVVVTSQRAVAAWKRAAEDLGQGDGKGKGKAVVGDGWDEVPFFAVGPATATALQAVPGPSRSLVLGGRETGTSASLGSFILARFSSRPSPSDPPLPLLYLTGDKRSPALPSILSSADPPIPFVEKQVYATVPSTSIGSEVESLLDTLASHSTTADDAGLEWIALFSPSGAKTVFPTLHSRDLLSPLSDPRKRLKVAAIGPTTETWLKEQGVRPEAVAERPEAEALVRAVVEVDRAGGAG